MSARLAVLVSGGGSNLQAVLDACATGALPARVVGVVSNRVDAFALERARLAGVPHTVVPPLTGEARSDYDARLRDAVQHWQPDVVILAGFMRVSVGCFSTRSHYES